MTSQASILDEPTTLTSADIGEATMASADVRKTTQEIADSQSEDEEYDLLDRLGEEGDDYGSI